MSSLYIIYVYNKKSKYAVEHCNKNMHVQCTTCMLGKAKNQHQLLNNRTYNENIMWPKVTTAVKCGITKPEQWNHCNRTNPKLTTATQQVKNNVHLTYLTRAFSGNELHQYWWPNTTSKTIHRKTNHKANKHAGPCQVYACKNTRIHLKTSNLAIYLKRRKNCVQSDKMWNTT